MFFIACNCKILPIKRGVGSIKDINNSNLVIPENEQLDSAPNVYMNWPKNIVKPFVGIVKSEGNAGNNASGPKFKRFLKANDIPYEEYDINRSDFIEEAKKFDVIVWRIETTYSKQWEAADKLEILDKYLGKMVLPSSEALWVDEDKLRAQYVFEINNFPMIKTFSSHSEAETMEYIEACEYPIISKDKICASGHGVYMIKDKIQAKEICNEIFSTGLKTNEDYILQKDYVYFQEFVPNYGFDLRIVMIGDYFFGYYRLPKDHDFKASGSGIVEKKELPVEAMLLAKHVRESLPKSNSLAVDFIRDTRDDRYYIVETSIFVGIETCEQLMVDGIPGRYIEKDETFTFEPGRFWLQELMLEDLMKDWIEKHS